MSRLKAGINDLRTKSPDIAKEWDYSKNAPLTPEAVCNSSTMRVWWVCEHGHSWDATIDSRTSGMRKCPICSNQRVVSGYNDFATLCPELLTSWDYEKNDEDPTRISGGYSKSVWWRCELGHSWKTSISSRKKQDGCPYCRGKKILSGFNDFATRFPHLLSEWDYEKNTIDPSTIAPATAKRYHWICPNGHRYEAAISGRTRLNAGCPYCANQKLLKGFNDFETRYPQIAKEWDYDKNGDKLPSDYIGASENYAWWKCAKGHSWKTMISTRVGGTGCPICAKEYKTSIPEQAVFYYCRKHYPDAINGYHPDWLGKSELDVFIPSLMVAIEFDGRAWHKSIEKDISKNQLCHKHGIRVFRIREPGLKLFDDDCIGFEKISYESLSGAIITLVGYLGVAKEDIDVNIERDLDSIYALMNYREKTQSISSNYPDVASEWDYSKNSVYLSPEVVNCNSKLKVFWLCPKGHSYETRVEHRTRLNSGCPYCAGKKALPGYNDLASQHPDLLKEWDYTKNTLAPTDCTSGSSKKVWWICSDGHEWEAAISSRAKGSGCPYCSGLKVIPGVNDLVTLAPDLLDGWDYQRNKDTSPDSISPHSHKVVWWKCSAGHTWQEMIRKRFLSKKRNCPICKK